MSKRENIASDLITKLDANFLTIIPNIIGTVTIRNIFNEMLIIERFSSKIL